MAGRARGGARTRGGCAWASELLRCGQLAAVPTERGLHGLAVADRVELASAVGEVDGPLQLGGEAPPARAAGQQVERDGASTVAGALVATVRHRCPPCQPYRRGRRQRRAARATLPPTCRPICAQWRRTPAPPRPPARLVPAAQRGRRARPGVRAAFLRIARPARVRGRTRTSRARRRGRVGGLPR